MFDILYLANNRPEFTAASLEALVANTDWNLVGKLIIYFDYPQEAKDGFLGIMMCLSMNGLPPQTHHGQSTEIVFSSFGGPVGVMLDFLERTKNHTSEYFIKIDNDFVVPPGWLGAVNSILAYQDWDLLGLEARHGEESSKHSRHAIRVTKDRSTTRADFIGGVGAMRYAVFERFPDLKAHEKYFGFGIWQGKHMEVSKAWIDPPLRCFLLDHLPFEPWKSISEEYTKAGIQRRQWGYYGEEHSKLWSWWEPRWKEKM